MYMIDVLLHNGAHIRFEDSSDSTISQLRAHMADHFPNSLRAAIVDPTQFALYAFGQVPLINEDDTIGEYIRARPDIAIANLIRLMAVRRHHLPRQNSSRKTRKVSRTRRNKSRKNRL
jgi:hypothetical protein